MKWKNLQLTIVTAVKLTFVSIVVLCLVYPTLIVHFDSFFVTTSPVSSPFTVHNSGLLPPSPPHKVTLKSTLSTKNRFANKKLFPCDDFIPRYHFEQRGNFWVLYNYINRYMNEFVSCVDNVRGYHRGPYNNISTMANYEVTATRSFRCDEAVTYTTHGDFRFLDNLIPLAERWRGPISVAIYAPGADYEETVLRIKYLRKCTSPLIKELTNFHLYFDNEHLSKNISKRKTWETSIDCKKRPSFGENIKTFRIRKGLTYHVNVARNIARDMAPTHHVLASDIELYPNPDVIKDFLQMIRRNESRLRRNSKPKVFVLPIFEVEKNVTVLPKNKKELQIMLAQGTAVPFHTFICEECHKFPEQKAWMKAKHRKGAGLNVFHVGKRLWAFLNWEPIYIGTKWDPHYDERLTWEGQRDKMTQGYILCVLDYEFHILNNAFLIHRPGIKRPKPQAVAPANNITEVTMRTAVQTQIKLINEVIWPELKLLYGHRDGCQS